MKTYSRHALIIIFFVSLSILTVTNAIAADKLKIASTQRGFWDTTLVLWGNEQGFFQDEDIDLDILWTAGGADAVQAAVSGGVDITMATGITGVVGAWSKGAPIRIISAQMTGPSDLFWYVKKASPIKSLRDLNGKTFAFSRPGSSTHAVALALAKESAVGATLLSTGGPAATLTQVMSNQVDVGWSAGAVNFDKIVGGELRLIARGSDVREMRSQTVRVNIANADFLDRRPDLVKRFLRAMQRTIDWAYTENKALERYAEMSGVSFDVARQARDELYPKAALVLKPVSNVDLTIEQSVENKYLDKPLAPPEITDMLRYVNVLSQ